MIQVALSQYTRNTRKSSRSMKTILLLSLFIPNLFASHCNSKEFIQYVVAQETRLNKSYAQAKCKSFGFHLMVPEDEKDEDCLTALHLSNARCGHGFLGITRNRTGHWIRDDDRTEIKFAGRWADDFHEGNCVVVNYYPGDECDR